MAKALILLFFELLCSIVTAQQPSSLTIRSVVDIAIEKSFYLKSKRYNVDIIGSNITTASLRPNPVFNNQNLFLLNKNKAYYWSALPGSPTDNIFDSENNQLWFQITKPIQLGRLRQNKISFSLQGYELSKLNYGKEEADYFFEIGNQFIHASILYKNILILTEIKNINDSIIVINDNKLKNGMISPTDVTRIRLTSDIYLLKIKLAELDYRNDINRLKYELGIDDSIILEEMNIDNSPISLNKDSIISQGFSNRYDIKLAQCSTSYYSKNIALQKSLSYPYFEGGIILNPQNSITYAGTYVTMGLPVFDRNQGGIQKSQVLYKQSQVVLENMKNKASIAMLNAYDAYTASKEITDKYSATLVRAKMVFQSVKYNYLRGNTSVLDFLEAEKTYLNLSIQYKDALSRYQLAYINLLYNLGLINKI